MPHSRVYLRRVGPHNNLNNNNNVERDQDAIGTRDLNVRSPVLMLAPQSESTLGSVLASNGQPQPVDQVPQPVVQQQAPADPGTIQQQQQQQQPPVAAGMTPELPAAAANTPLGPILSSTIWWTAPTATSTTVWWTQSPVTQPTLSTIQSPPIPISSPSMSTSTALPTVSSIGTSLPSSVTSSTVTPSSSIQPSSSSSSSSSSATPSTTTANPTAINASNDSTDQSFGYNMAHSPIYISLTAVIAIAVVALMSWCLAVVLRRWCKRRRQERLGGMLDGFDEEDKWVGAAGLRGEKGIGIGIGIGMGTGSGSAGMNRLDSDWSAGEVHERHPTMGEKVSGQDFTGSATTPLNEMSTPARGWNGQRHQPDHHPQLPSATLPSPFDPAWAWMGLSGDNNNTSRSATSTPVNEDRYTAFQTTRGLNIRNGVVAAAGGGRTSPDQSSPFRDNRFNQASRDGPAHTQLYRGNSGRYERHRYSNWNNDDDHDDHDGGYGENNGSPVSSNPSHAQATIIGEGESIAPTLSSNPSNDTLTEGGSGSGGSGSGSGSGRWRNLTSPPAGMSRQPSSSSTSAFSDSSAIRQPKRALRASVPAGGPTRAQRLLQERRRLASGGGPVPYQ